MNDKVPPQDTKAEQLLLGSMLIDPSIHDNVMLIMTPECFYNQRHASIYDAMRSVYQKRETIDILTTVNALKASNNLERVGGASFVSSLTAGLSSGMNYGSYLGSVYENYARRKLIAYSMQIEGKSYSYADDVDDIMSEANAGLMDVMDLFAGAKKARTIYELADESVTQYFERKKRRESGDTTGIETPLNRLTQITGGWQDGEVIVIAGRTAMGKTAFALHCALTCAMKSKSIQFFSFEMSEVRLADRIVVMNSGVSPDGFKYGNLLDAGESTLEKSLDSLRGMGIYIDDDSNQTIEQVFSKARIAKKNGRCDLVIVDYLQLVKPGKRKEIREQEVADMSRKCKLYAKELNVPVIILAQVGRGAETTADKRPQLKDLRESGAIEQDADMVLFTYRPEYYGIAEIDHRGETVSTEGLGVIIISKHRNGEVGDVLFRYEKGLTKISDMKRNIPDYHNDQPF